MVASRSNLYVDKYGLSLQQVQQIWLDQDCKCAICHVELPDPGEVTSVDRAANVDHCHKTGRVRGILCSPCNRGLGCFKDNTVLLADAASYLLSYRHRYHGLSKLEKRFVKKRFVRPRIQKITYEGKTQAISKWAKELDISYITLYTRLVKLKWPIEKALTTPVTTTTTTKTTSSPYSLQALTHESKIQSISEWAKELDIPYSVLYQRLFVMKWSVEKALTTPFRKEKSPRRVPIISYKDKTQSVSQWAKELGIPRFALYQRLFIKKWSIERALTTPIRPRRKKSEL